MQYDRDDNPHVFILDSNDAKLELNTYWAKPDDRWNDDNAFVFRFRKLFHFQRAVRRAGFVLGLIC